MLGLRHDYSFSEGVLSFWATGILTVMAVTSLLLRYVTSPVTCFLPAQFEPSQVDYAIQACFRSQFIRTPSQFVEPDEVHPVHYTYHQWLPFFLGMAATLCLLPHLTWRMLSGFLWLDGHRLVHTLTLNQQNAAARHVMLRDCALLLQAGLKGGNSALALAALGRKALGCAVCFLQMLLMLLVFAPRLDHQADKDEEEFVAVDNDTIPLPTGSFTCSFTIRHLQRVMEYAVQCEMHMAQVYTKGLVFLVYFFLVLFLLFALDLTLWILRLAVPRLKDMALTRFLAAASASASGSQAGSQAEPNSARLSRFLDSLGLDGRWVLAVVADECGAVVAADLTGHLLQVFKDSPRPTPSVTSPADSSAPGSPVREETGADEGAIPMVTIGDKDGGTAAQDEEKGKV